MSKENGQTIQCPKKKDKQYNDKKTGQIIQCPKKKDIQYNVQRKRTNNTMSKEKGQTIQ